jgi:hypothetical protein
LVAAVAVIAAVVPTADALAQWTADTGVNTLVSGGPTVPGLQAKVRLSPVPQAQGGGAYIAWWQSEDAPVYWSLRLNRLTPAGQKAWAADAVIASTAASSAAGATTVNGSLYDVNYDLKTDASGNALLAWTDFRALSTRNVFVQRVGPTGTPAWTPGGVALSNDSAFKRDPRVVPLTDGRAAVVWFASTSPPSLRAQIVDGAGTPVLASGAQAIATATTPSRPPDRFEVVASTDGAFIVSWVREFSTSTSALRHIVAQKFVPGVAGPLVGTWNAGSPVTVSDQNITVQTQTVPFATFHPRVALAPTPEGGCVVAYFDARTGTQNVYAQRLSSAGVPAWATSGVAISTDAARARIEPAIAFDPGTDAVWVFSRETDAVAGTRGVSVQRLNAAGERTLGDPAPLVAPLSASFKYALQASASGPGAVVAWNDDPGTPGAQTLAAARVDASGATTWTGDVVPVASTPSVKNFVQHPADTSPAASVARDGFAMLVGYPTGVVLAWQDARSGDADVYAQQLSLCGTPGLESAGDFNQNGAATIDDIFIYLNAWFASDPGTDVDAQGGVTIDDIFVFLSRWFAGC